MKKRNFLIVLFLILLVAGGGYFWYESAKVFLPKEEQIVIEPIEAPLDFTYFDSKEYPENSLAALIQKTPELKEKFSGRDLDKIFCFEDGSIEDQSIRCVRPVGIKIDEKDSQDQVGLFQNASRSLEFEVAQNNVKKTDVKVEIVKLDPNFVDKSKYAKNTIAAYVQKNPEIIERFRGKPLTDEFCFEERLSGLESEVKCITPSDFLESEEVYFDRVLDDLLSMKNAPNIETLPFEELPFKNQTFIKIHDFENADYFGLTEELKNNYVQESANTEELESLSYIYALEGDYDNSEAVAAYNCEKFEIQCSKDTQIKLSGKVMSGEGLTMSGAKIEVLSDSLLEPVFTNSQGYYELEFSLYDFTKARIKASKVGFSDGVIPLNVFNNPEQTLEDVDFVLHAPVQVVTLNNENKTFVGNGVKIEGDAFIVETQWSKYTIPFDSLMHRDGSPFLGQVDAFLFEFDKSSNLDALINNDVFDEVSGYAGNIMKTFGMPYVLFKTPEGETIHVLKSSPMTLQSQIIEMEALYTNQDQIYSELTADDMEYLYAKSQELGGYPIDRDFLTSPDYLLVKFPAFWVFDQVKGLWENQGVKLLNTKGLVEIPFYTLNNL